MLVSAMSELPLGPREKRLLRRIAAGKTDAQIAVHIGGSAEQVSKQRARLLGRLGISSQAEITAAAQRLAPDQLQGRYLTKSYQGPLSDAAFAGDARRRAARIIVTAHSGFNFVRIGTQRRCAAWRNAVVGHKVSDGPRADHLRVSNSQDRRAAESCGNCRLAVIDLRDCSTSGRDRSMRSFRLAKCGGELEMTSCVVAR